MSAVRDAMASVTDAFLGDRTAPRLRDQRALLLVGHLPVMGGLWLTQFADRDARTSGTTALVRVLHGEVELEVLRAGGRKIDVDAKDGFEQALTKVASTVGRWIFCVFGDAEAQIPAALDGIDRVILLTGADDAATVGAYKLLKGFVEHAERAGRAVPPIELCIVGATEAEAREMAEKLDRTTRAFLRANLVVGAAIQRMDAVESSFRESYELPSASLDAVCAAVTRAVSARASRFDTAQVSATKATTRTPPRATMSVDVEHVDVSPVVPEHFSAVLPFRIGPVNAAPSRVAPVVVRSAHSRTFATCDSSTPLEGHRVSTRRARNTSRRRARVKHRTHDARSSMGNRARRTSRTRVSKHAARKRRRHRHHPRAQRTRRAHRADHTRSHGVSPDHRDQS